MKSSRTDVRTSTHAIPELQFEEQSLTSFSGLIVFQKLFATLNLRSRLRACFRNRVSGAIFPIPTVVQLLVLHCLMGYRELKQSRFYADDPMVLRLLGLKKLPDVSTISRQLSSMDDRGVLNLAELTQELVFDRLKQTPLDKLTLDFDGSVLGTGRRAEGTAVGFNKSKKGQRSYYPLFCTVAQTSQVLSVLHRSGNIHDSNGARQFILNNVARALQELPQTPVELRMDSAFFSDEIVAALDKSDVTYSISVPFERFPELKEKIEERVRWNPVTEDSDSFEQRWKPKSWKRKHRFVFVRQCSPVQNKKPLQLDLFVPRDYQYSYKVVLTNKSDEVADLLHFHEGRGSQENIFSELKSENALGYIPTRTWNGNQVYLLCTVLAHNLTRELQMATTEPVQRDDSKRPALWVFERLGTFRNEIIRRAGRLISPQGQLTLSMSASAIARSKIRNHLAVLGCVP